MWDLLELSAEEIVRSEGDLEVSLVGFAKKKKLGSSNMPSIQPSMDTIDDFNGFKASMEILLNLETVPRKGTFMITASSDITSIQLSMGTYYLPNKEN